MTELVGFVLARAHAGWVRATTVLQAERWLIWCVALAMFLSLLCYTGYYGSDDMAYLMGIEQLANGKDLLVQIGTDRLIFLLPAVPIAWLTDGSNFAIIFSFTLYFPVLVVLTHRLALKLFPRPVANLAALLTATNPLLYLYAGALLPDIAMTVWMTAALVLVVGLFGKDSPDWRHALSVCLGAGICCGFAYGVKQAGLLIAVPCGIAISLSVGQVLSRQTVALGAALAAGLLLVVVGEALAFSLLTGDGSARHGVMASIEGDLAWHARRQGMYPWQRLNFVWDALKLHGNVLRYVFVVAMPLYFVSHRRRQDLWLGGTVLWLAGYLIVGTSSFTRYLPAPLQDRYFAICVPTFAIALAASLFALASRPFPKHSLAVGTLVAVLLFGLGFRTHKHVIGSIYRSREVRAVLEVLLVAKRQHAGLPLALSAFPKSRTRYLWYNQNYGHYWAVEVVSRAEAEKTGPGDARIDELLVLRMPEEWLEEFGSALEAPDKLVRVQTGAGELGFGYLDPQDFTIERLYLAGQEANRAEELRPFVSKFLQDINARYEPAAEAFATVVLERWLRKSATKTTDRAFFSERNAGQWLVGADEASRAVFRNRRLELAHPSKDRARLSLFAEPKAKAPTHPMAFLPSGKQELFVRVPLRNLGGQSHYRLWIELWDDSSAKQSSTVGVLDPSTERDVVLSVTPSETAKTFRLGLEFTRIGSKPTVVQVEPLEIYQVTPVSDNNAAD